MVFLAGIVLHTVLIAAQQRTTTEFRITKAYVSYEARETNLGSSLKTTIGRNKDLSLLLLTSPEGTQAKLVISAAGFKTDRPMRDWSVKTLYLKSGTYPEITFAVTKIDGESLSKVLQPLQKGTALKADPIGMLVGLFVPDKEGASLLLRAGGEDIAIRGKLRDDILKAINTGKGDIPVTGKLTVAGGAKDFGTVVSFHKTGNNKFTLSTVIDAKFTDFGLSAPAIPWFIEVHNNLVLQGHAIIEVLK